MATRILFLLCLIAHAPSWAQPRLEHLEGRLAEAEGKERLGLLADLAVAYQEEAPDRALVFGAEALQLLDLDPGPEREMDVLKALLVAAIDVRAFDRALAYGDRAEQRARALEDPHALAFVLRKKGNVYRFLNQYDRALDVLAEAIQLDEERGVAPDLGEGLYYAGAVSWLVGDYPGALAYGFRAHAAYEEAADSLAIGRVLNVLGLVYWDMTQYDKALEYFHQSLGIHEARGKEGEVAKLLNNIGNVYRDRDEPARALDYYLRSLNVKERLDDRQGIANTLNNIGRAYRRLGDLDRAFAFYQRSLQMRNELGDKEGITGTLRHIAHVHREQGRYEAAIDTLVTSVALASAIRAKDDLQHAYRDLAETYAGAGRYREALDAFMQYEVLKSERFNEHNSKTIAEMEARFEAGQKQKEIEILKQQHAISSLTLSRQRTYATALLGGFALSLAILVLLYGRYRLRTRTAAAIRKKNLDLEYALAGLQESEDRYRRLFDEPATARLLIDPVDGRILDANASAGALLGRALQDVIGQTEATLACPWLSRITRRLSETGLDRPAGFVEAFQHGDEAARDVEAWVNLLVLAGRRAALVTLHDVTERRRLQEEQVRREERERYIADLEAKNAEVEARNAEMERFTYTVSHDLKAPVVTIKGFLGLLRKDMARGDEERMEQDLQQIGGAADTMHRLLSELLELSRVGRLINPDEDLALTDLAHTAASLLAVPAAARGVAVDIDPAMPHVVGDRTRLVEVYQNLLDNAIKFMGDQPDPLVEVGALQRDGQVTCYVRDNGVGIEPEYHEQIFGLFERLDAGVDGTGVGLALVKRIVEMHGGTIWVESDGAGRGSAFYFILPCAVGPRPHPPDTTLKGL